MEVWGFLQFALQTLMVCVSEDIKIQVTLGCKVIVRVSAVSSCWWNGSSPKVVKYSVYWMVMHALEDERHFHFSIEICLCIEVHMIFLFINLDSKNLMYKEFCLSKFLAARYHLASLNWVEQRYTHWIPDWLEIRESSSFCFEAIALWDFSSYLILAVLVLLNLF